MRIIIIWFSSGRRSVFVSVSPVARRCSRILSYRARVVNNRYLDGSRELIGIITSLRCFKIFKRMMLFARAIINKNDPETAAPERKFR
jgi:hypothetical protein